MKSNFPQTLEYNGRTHSIGSLSVRDVQILTFSDNTAEVVALLKNIKSNDLPGEVFWPNVYRLSFIDSSEGVAKSFVAELENCNTQEEGVDIILKYLKIDHSDHFENLYLVHKYWMATHAEVENMDFWFFQCCVAEIKKQLKKDDDKRKGGQSMERH